MLSRSVVGCDDFVRIAHFKGECDIRRAKCSCALRVQVSKP